MLSKFLRLGPPCTKRLLVLRMVGPSVRRMGLIPPSQYDVPWPNRFKFGYVVRVYWETIPLFAITLFSITLVVGYILWCVANKVEIVFSPNSRNNISRTMDLRHPTIHKLITINQKYDPWPEMQDVLDKMKTAERRLAARTQTCGFDPNSE